MSRIQINASEHACTTTRRTRFWWKLTNEHQKPPQRRRYELLYAFLAVTVYRFTRSFANMYTYIGDAFEAQQTSLFEILKCGAELANLLEMPFTAASENRIQCSRSKITCAFPFGFSGVLVFFPYLANRVHVVCRHGLYAQLSRNISEHTRLRQTVCSIDRNTRARRLFVVDTYQPAALQTHATRMSGGFSSIIPFRFVTHFFRCVLYNPIIYFPRF